MNRKLIAAIAVYFGLIALCCIVLYAVPSVRGMLERTYIAEYGSIDVKDDVSAFVVRDEKVYVAGQASLINRLAEPDKLVKAHTKVVELTPDEESIEIDEAAEAAREAGKTGEDADDETAAAGKYTDMLEELGDAVRTTNKGYNKGAGYISYYIDGAEAALSTENLDILTKKELKSLTKRRAVEVPSRKCRSGYPIFKVVKNAKWYIIYYLSNEEAAKYEPGSSVTIDINGEPVDVIVSQVREEGDESRIVLSCKTFFDGFLEKRTLDTTVTLVSAEGLVLQDSSIVDSPDGRRGVFVKNKLGEHVFKPIKVKADDGKRCVVFSDLYVDSEGRFVETIATYDEIISEPTEEDLEALAEEVKERQKAEAAEKAAAEKAAAEEEAAEKAAAQNAAEEAKKAKAEAEKKAKEAEEAAKEAEKKAKEAEEAAKEAEKKDKDKD